LIIEGAPKINSSINYTKKGIKHKPSTAQENEKKLRASIINLLPFDFKPFNGPLRINMLHLIFAPAPSLGNEERSIIVHGGSINKTSKPDFTDCLKDMFKAMLGIVFCCDTQICEITNFKKTISARPCIEIEIEEIL
jgi:Holliday junction resolvase RusA-like endonuclease